MTRIDTTHNGLWVDEMLTKISRKKSVSCFATPLTEENQNEREEMGLGIAISQFCEWDGLKILRIFYSALENSNFHAECAEVQKMIDVYENEMLAYKEE